MIPRGDPNETFKFIIIAVILMVIVDYFWPNRHSPDKYRDPPAATAEHNVSSKIADVISTFDEYNTSSEILDVVRKRDVHRKDVPEEPVPAITAPTKEEEPINYKMRQYDGPPRVSIIIDDLGLGKKNTQRIVDLPAPLTLAFLPYAPNLAPITQESLTKGHELIIHTPMEPINPALDPGSIALLDDMNVQDFDAALETIFKSFDGYVGINNHMGSKLTQNKDAMNRVMSELKKRDLIFVDSKTIHSSVAAETAAQHGLSYAERDVFIDHYPDLERVNAALVQMEKTALRRGYAIGIGHPKKNTIAALKAWLPTLRDKGIILVPVSDLVKTPEKKKQNTIGTALKDLRKFKPFKMPFKPDVIAP